MLPTQILNKLTVAENVPQVIAEMLLNVGIFENIKTKSILIDNKEQCQDIYFILTGGFVCQYLIEAGEYKTINFYLHNYQQFFTIPSAYFFNKPSGFKVKAVKDSSVLRLPKKSLVELTNKSSDFSEWYHNRIITALVEEIESKTNLISFNSKQLYQSLIHNSPQIIQEVPSTYIAQYLGISREHLSRIRHLR